MGFFSWLRTRARPKNPDPSQRCRRYQLHRKLAERCRLTLELLEDRLCPSALALGAPTLAPPDAGTQAQVSQAYGQLPLSFEANQG